jgi:cobalt-zinc-cadmium efflux system outer membrane protein
MFMTVLSGMSSHAPAAEPNARAYGLDEVVTLALQRHPAIAAAGGTIKERQGERLAADAYPNPSASGSLGRGAIRDPSNGIAILERTLTIAQPLEWPAKRAARQRAADAGLAGAHAGLEDARLGVQADVKEAFYRLLLAQKDADMASQNLATVSEVLGTVRARLAAGEATRFETVKADVEVQKARKEVSRTANAVIAAQVKLNRLTADALGNDFSIQGDFDSPPRETGSRRSAGWANLSSRRNRRWCWSANPEFPMWPCPAPTTGKPATSL